MTQTLTESRDLTNREPFDEKFEGTVKGIMPSLKKYSAFNDTIPEENRADMQYKYGVLEEKGMVELLSRCKDEGEKKVGKTEDFDGCLKKATQDFLGKKIEWDGLRGEELFERVVYFVPEDKWMRFVRLHLNLPDEAIEDFKKKHCSDKTMYTLI